MQTRLLTIAGEADLSTRASPAEREDYESLRSCENLPIGEPAGGPVPDPSPFPPAGSNWALLETVRTPRIGIEHEPADRGAFSEGAAVVRSVAPDSPAERAGLRVSDVILGPPGEPFTERNEIRGWLKLVPVGEPVSLEVDRGENRLVVSVVPADAAATRESSGGETSPRSVPEAGGNGHRR